METATERSHDALQTRTVTMLEAVLAMVQLYLGPDVRLTTFVRDGEEWVFRFARNPACSPSRSKPVPASPQRTDATSTG